MFKYYGIAIAFLASASPAFCQSVIWQESFENDGEGVRYFPSNTFYDGGHDHFRLTDGSDISITGGNYAGYEGLYFWAGEDMDDTGDPANDGSATKEVIFNKISTSGYNNLRFSGLFAAGNDGPAGSNAYDDEDSVVVYYSLDRGETYIKALKFASTGDQSNEPLAFDSDLDGMGDSTVLSPLMQEFFFSIPDADYLQIKISMSMNAGSEEFAFDNFQVSGEYDGLSSLPAAVSFAVSSDTISESAGEYGLPILFENPSDTIVVTTRFIGDSSKILHFKEEVTLIAQQDSVVLSTVGIADDEEIDGLTKLIFNIAEISGGYEPYVKEPSSFTLYVVDDEIPEGGEVIISELMYDSKSSADEEWVELFNTTALPVNISGWYLTDDDSYPADQEGDVVIPEGTYIYPDQYLVLSWKDVADFEGEVILDKNTGSRSYAPGLTNTGDNMALYSTGTGTGVLIDGSLSTFYSDKSPANAGHSIERVQGSVWEWTSSINNFGGVEIIRGTPGAVNSTWYTGISFDSPENIALEGSSISLPIKISSPSDTNSTYAEIILSNGDSTEIEDFLHTVLFPAGSGDLQFVQINIKDDSVTGKTDTLLFKIKKATGGLNAYVSVDSLFQLIIKDNDLTSVEFESDSVQIQEGDSVEINVIVSNPHPDLSTTVFLRGEMGVDLLLFSEEVNISPGESKDKIMIKAAFDGVEEGAEYFNLKISGAAGGNAAFVGADSSVVIKVVDDHPTTIGFSQSADSIAESKPKFLLPIVITNPSTDSITTVGIQLLSGDSTDIAGFHHGHVEFTSIIADTLYFEIPIFNDSIRERTEQFSFCLVDVSGGHYSRIVDPDIFTLTIIDDEEEIYNLIFNEILFDPPVDTVKGDANNDGVRSSIEDEFVELVNIDPLSLDISGFSINDATAIRHIFPEGTVLAPMQGIVIFGGGLPAGDYGGSIVQTASSGRLSLNNSGDNIYLINKADTIATLTYSGSMGNDQSITRSPDMAGDFGKHLSVSAQLYSPGYQVNGLKFNEKLPDPFIYVETSSFGHDFGPVYFSDTSGIRSYELRAGNLQDSLFITVPSGFELSINTVDWIVEGDVLPIHTSDSVRMEIFVRFIPGTSENRNYKGEIIHSTINADTTYVALSGQGIEKPEPAIIISTDSIHFGIVTRDQQDAIFSYTISGAKLVDTLFIEAPRNFAISSDNTGFFQKLHISPDINGTIDERIYVRFDPASEGTYYGELIHSTAWYKEVVMMLEAEYLQPVLELSVNTIDFDLVVNGDQTVKSYTLNGKSLAGSVTIMSPLGTRISIKEDFVNATNQLLIDPDENRKIQQEIFVDYHPGSAGFLADDVLHSTEGADTVKLFVEGEFIIPSIEVDPRVLDFDKHYVSEEAEILSYTIYAQSVVGELKVFSPPGFEFVLEDNFNEPADSLVLEPDNREIVQKVYVRFNTDRIGSFYDSVRHSVHGASNKFLIIKGETDKITSIKNDKFNGTINIYPVPTDNFLKVETATNSRKYIRLLNTPGREVLSMKFTEQATLDTSMLDAGLYYLHIFSEVEDIKIKIIIMH